MAFTVPIEVKKECCRLKSEGVPVKEIYDSYYSKLFDKPCCYNTFRRALLRWPNKVFPDDTTLECGTYEGFIAHNATVQVSKTG